MAGIFDIILGAAEIGAGAFTGIAPLITAGAGTLLTGIGQEIGGSAVKGFATATRNPIAPWKIVYGNVRTGGTPVYMHTWGSNDQMLDMVIVLAANASQSIDAVLFDQQLVQIDQTAIPTSAKAGYTIPTPVTGSGTSFTPVQQTVSISSIVRSAQGVVTVTLPANIPYLTAGAQIRIQNVTGDLTLNGTFQVAQIISQVFGGPGYIVFTYINGGSPAIVDNEGQAVTVWPDYGRNVYVEYLLGAQTLGQSFIGMLAGAPWQGTGKLCTPASPQNAGGTAAPNPWTNYCSLQGKTAVFIRLTLDKTAFPSGIPQISFLMHGKNDISDPRTSPATVGYTDNSALCIADFLSNQTWGYKAGYGSDINVPALIGAANTCDETIALVVGGTEKRYTCDGQFELTEGRGAILQNMLTSCAGRLTDQGGGIAILPGSWEPSTAGYNWTPRVAVANYDGLEVYDCIGAIQGIYGGIANWPGGCNVINWASICALKAAHPLIAPAFVQCTGNASTNIGAGFTTWTTAFSSAVTAGNCLVVDVAFSTAYPLSMASVTDSLGNTYKPVLGAHAAGAASFLICFVAPNCLGGANTVTVTQTGSTNFQNIAVSVREYSGVSAVLPSGTPPFNIGGYSDNTGCCDASAISGGVLSNSITVNLTTSTSNDLLLFATSSQQYCAGVVLTSPYPTTGVNLLQLAAGAFKWSPTSSIRELYNGCKGTYISANNKWQSTDYPPYAQDYDHGYNGPSIYNGDINLAADGGERRWLELHLPFTTSSCMAQRIAKIELLRHRFGGTGNFPLNMGGYVFASGDIIAAAMAPLGWAGKLLEIKATRLRLDAADGAIRLGTEIDVQETDSSIYMWSTEEELSPQGYVQSNYPRGAVLPTSCWPWSPGYVAPLNGDAIYPQGAIGPASFGIQPVYGFDAQGNSAITLQVKGTPPINALDLTIANPQFFATASNTGGSLPPGDYVVGVSAYDSGSSTKANTDYLTLATVTVGGSGSGSIGITVNWGAGDDQGEVYVAQWNATGEYVFHFNQAIASGNTATITTFDQSTHGGPDPIFAYLGVVPQLEVHGGPFAALVYAVTSTTITIAANGMTLNQWAGYTLSLLAKANPAVEIPILNMAVASSTASSGSLFVLTIGPNSASVSLPNLTTLIAVGDVVMMRHNATFTATSFTDPNVANGIYPTGATGVEAGHLACVMTGIDAGDVQTIASVTVDGFGNYTVFNLAGSWVTTPATGDNVIICAPMNQPLFQTANLQTRSAAVGGIVVAQPNVSNLAGQTWLFRVRTLNAEQQSGPDSLAPYREVYIFGGQGTRTVTASTTQMPSDGMILCDTTAGSFNVQLLALSAVPNMTLIVKKISSDANTVTILPGGGDTIDGSASVVLASLLDLLQVKANG